jgi:hypothetical protein
MSLVGINQLEEGDTIEFQDAAGSSELVGDVEFLKYDPDNGVVTVFDRLEDEEYDIKVDQVRNVLDEHGNRSKVDVS